MKSIRELVGRLDSYAVGAAVGILVLAMPDVLADLVKVADQGTVVALLESMWHAFARSVVPMSIGAGVGFWMLRRWSRHFRAASSGRSMLSGFLTAALLVSLERFSAYGDVGLRDWIHFVLLATGGVFGVLIAHSRLSRGTLQSPAALTPEEELRQVR